jgi:hypothetical protein
MITDFASFGISENLKTVEEKFLIYLEFLQSLEQISIDDFKEETYMSLTRYQVEIFTAIAEAYNSLIRLMFYLEIPGENHIVKMNTRSFQLEMAVVKSRIIEPLNYQSLYYAFENHRTISERILETGQLTRIYLFNRDFHNSRLSFLIGLMKSINILLKSLMERDKEKFMSIYQSFSYGPTEFETMRKLRMLQKESWMGYILKNKHLFS